MTEISATGGPSDTARPSADVDRRALSQAWYDALYARHDGRGVNAGAARRSTESGSTEERAARPASARVPESVSRSTAPRNAVRLRLLAASGALRTRSAATRPKLLARAVARTTVFRHGTRLVKLANQQLDFVVQQHGDLLRLVAIYDGRKSGQVVSALRQARAALTERGLRVELDVRPRAGAAGKESDD